MHLYIKTRLTLWLCIPHSFVPANEISALFLSPLNFSAKTDLNLIFVEELK